MLFPAADTLTVNMKRNVTVAYCMFRSRTLKQV